ncbi:MAG TPA: NfeD family protein [Cyclobacteriaceae bacterium]
MENYLAWVLIGFCLVIVELLSGTFYLLVLGISAFGAAAVAYFGMSFPVQAITATVVAAAGSWLVHLYRVKNSQQQMRSMDYAQPVIFESWLNQPGRMATVRYRGAQWEAMLESDEDVKAGSTLYILTANGNTLTVSKSRPDK